MSCINIMLMKYNPNHAKELVNLCCPCKEYQGNKTEFKPTLIEFKKDIRKSIKQGNFWYTLFIEDSNMVITKGSDEVEVLELNPKVEKFKDINRIAIGYAIIKPDNRFDDINKTASIEYYIDKKYQRNGIGTLMISLIIMQARKNDFRKLLAAPYCLNYGSRKVLDKAEFRNVGILQNHMKANDSSTYYSLSLYEYLL